MITEIIDPPRRGRSLYVVWGGSLDFSLMSADEVEVDHGTAAADGRPSRPPVPGWRSLLIDPDLDTFSDGE